MKNQKKLLLREIAPAPAQTAGLPDNLTFYDSHSRNAYVCGMRIIDNAGTQTLETTIYTPEGHPVMRTFLDDFKWITQILNAETAHTTLTEAEFGNILWASQWDQRRTEGRELTGAYSYGEDAAGAAETFFKSFGRNYTPLNRLDQYQKSLRENVVRLRNDRIRKSIDDVMLQIRPLPKDFEDWVNDEALRDSRYIFYDYRKGRAWMDGYCTVCNHDVRVHNPRHNKSGKCPNCGKKITYKARLKTTQLCDDCNVAYIQSLPDGHVIRYFHVSKDYINRGYRDVRPYINETAREFDTEKGHRLFEWGNFRNTGEYRFCEQYSDHYYAGSILYPKNLKKLFRDDPHRKYFPFADVVKHAPEMSVPDLLCDAVRKPQLEIIAKLKLYRLTADIVNGYGDELIEKGLKGLSARGFAKNDIPVLRKLDPGTKELEIYLSAKKSGIEQAVEAVKFYRGTSQLLLDSFIDLFKYATPHRVVRYLTEQGKRIIGNNDERPNRYGYRTLRYYDMQDVAQAWNDYLLMCKDLQYDMKNEFVLFPLHLSQAHDAADAAVTAQREKIHNRKLAGIAEMKEEYDAKFAWHTKTLMIRAPRAAEEIVAEGQKLHHCVGSYVDRVADRETVILFIRKADDPETPFCTLEFRDGEVQQCYGHHDTKIPPEVQKFVDAWLHIKRPADAQENSRAAG